MSRVRIDQFQHFLFSTDMEPDDIASIMLFFQQISKQAKQSSSPIKIAFLVGEGNSAIKAAAMQKLIDEYKKIYPLQNTEMSIIQGYGNKWGAQRNFINEGKDLLTTEEVQQAKGMSPDGDDKETKRVAREKIKQFLTEHAKTLVISLKPMGELQDIAKEDSSIFAKHVLVCTGGYNFRTTFYAKERAEAEQKQRDLVSLLNLFAESYIYETRSTTEANSSSTANAPELFELLVKAKPNTLLGRFKSFISNWKEHQLGSDREALPDLLKQSELAINPAEQRRFIEIVSKDYVASDDDFLRQMLTQGKAKFKDNKDLFELLQRLERILTKWKSITQVPMQMVNADPGLLAVLTGACDPYVSVHSAKIRFGAQYTVLDQPDESDRTFVFLAGHEMTLDHYLSCRLIEDEHKFKSVGLTAPQEALFARINRLITAAAREIDALSLSLEEPKQTVEIIRLAGGSPLHTQGRESGSSLSDDSAKVGFRYLY